MYSVHATLKRKAEHKHAQASKTGSLEERKGKNNKKRKENKKIKGKERERRERNATQRGREDVPRKTK